MNNVKKSFINILSSFGGQIVSIALGIIIPRLTLINLGSEANGLMNSVNSFVGYLGLLEAGVGTATIQALYRPIAEQNRDQINGILSATDRFYKKTGSIYLAAVILASFVYMLGTSTDLSNISVFIVVMVTGLSGVFSYWFQGKYKLLLSAEGKSYITTNLNTVVSTAISIFKIILLMAGFDIIALQLMYFVFNILQVCTMLIYIKKKYKWINLKVKPDYNAISKKKSVLVHQISFMIFRNTDNLVLTMFCGFKAVSVYAMYNMLYNMLSNALDAFSGSITFWLGQTYQIDIEKYKKMNDLYEICSMVLGFALYSIATVFITPFLKLYTRGVKDISYIDKYLPFLFATIFILQIGRSSSSQTINFAGHFKETRKQTIIESVINLSVSILGVKLVGIYGVLFGTIAALIYRTNDMILYSAHKLLEQSSLPTYKRWITNIVLFLVIVRFVNPLVSSLNSYFYIIVYAAVITPIVLLIFLAINILTNIQETKILWDYMCRRRKR